MLFIFTIFLILSTDFINVASGDDGVIATISLQSFMPTKDLTTIDMSLSHDGSRLCVVYDDGSISVVDRTMYLRENPQRRSWAFQFVADDGWETPSSVDKFAQSQSPSVLSNAGSSEDVATEGLSMVSLERKALHRSASTSAKDLPDVVPLCYGDASGSGSCPALSPKLAFFRVESSSSIAEVENLFACSPSLQDGDTPVCSLPCGIPSARRSLDLGPSQSLFQSQTCPSLSPPFAVSDAGQEKAACCYFQLPYWKDKAQCRKVVWTASRLFIWLSVHSSVGVEENVIILFSRSSEKVFSFR